MKERGPEELQDLHAPGMQLVREWATRSRNYVEVLAATADGGRRCLHSLQVSDRSPLGAVALATGGLLVDHGWVRVLGSGHARLPRALDLWNGLTDGGGVESAQRLPGALLIGDDALGGFYAIDGGALGAVIGNVCYFSPDQLVWERVASGYADWLSGLLSGDLDEFYSGQRWSDWRSEVAMMPADCAVAIYPPLWRKGPPVGLRSRAPVPLEELWRLHVVDLPRQLGGDLS
ncbi:MAG: DUF2625 family protein [Planctomycetes bacterium]|nr:DUF2625 family protein [Planctomycetota bacterium]